MSKKATTETPAYKTLDELKEKGTITLIGDTREDLFSEVSQMKKNVPEGKHLVIGIVGRDKENGKFSLQVNLV